MYPWKPVASGGLLLRWAWLVPCVWLHGQWQPAGPPCLPGEQACTGHMQIFCRDGWVKELCWLLESLSIMSVWHDIMRGNYSYTNTWIFVELYMIAISFLILNPFLHIHTHTLNILLCGIDLRERYGSSSSCQEYSWVKGEAWLLIYFFRLSECMYFWRQTSMLWLIKDRKCCTCGWQLWPCSPPGRESPSWMAAEGGHWRGSSTRHCVLTLPPGASIGPPRHQECQHLAWWTLHTKG